MSETPPTIPSQDEVSDRVRKEVQRAYQRRIKGLDFLLAERVHVGAMEKEVVYRDGTAMLYRYLPVEDEIYRIPLMIVTPPSNKGYIFDLASGQSFVEFMLQRGYDVYILDWNSPRKDEASLDIADYVDRFIAGSIAKICEITGEEEVTLGGYCMGGVLALIYAALNSPGPVKNFVSFATPVDFTHMHLFQAWANKDHFDVDELVEELGLIPPELMLGAFDLARPANRTAGQINLWTNMWSEDFVKSYRMFDRWAAETLPVPGAYFRTQIKELMWKNALPAGELQIGGRTVDLGRITAPILNIVAMHDHIVSHEATQPLMTQTGSSDRKEIVSKGGHVSLVAGPAALRRLWPLIDDWLAERST